MELMACPFDSTRWEGIKCSSGERNELILWVYGLQPGSIILYYYSPILWIIFHFFAISKLHTCAPAYGFSLYNVPVWIASFVDVSHQDVDCFLCHPKAADRLLIERWIPLVCHIVRNLVSSR